jgi:membrane protein DedA with SNARE-associated domain
MVHGPVIRGALTLGAYVQRHVRGPRVDYIGVGIGALASWGGLPGPGEAALIAAGIASAHHRLDIGGAVAVAWLGAMLGGVAGWFAGIKAGRRIVAARGPFRRSRMHALERGERFYERFGTAAVFFTPSWVAGINRMRARRYLPANAASALLWALTFGLGSFYAGPPIVELVTDLSLVSAVVLGVLAAVVAGGMWSRRRRS